MTPKLKVLDLFSGIGGFSLGLERTGGFETVAFCEIDSFCRKVLSKHWPSVPIFEDVTKLKPINRTLPKGEETVVAVDVICGGFPCQDISVAGKQKGIGGERSGLWKEFYRLIKEVQPRYVVIENVANLRNQGLGRVLKDLWSIGYSAEWHIISARSVGACHLRERIWIVAYPHSSRIGDESRKPSNERRNSGQSRSESLQPEDREAQDLVARASGIESSYPDGKGLQGQRKSSRVQEEQPSTNCSTTSTTYPDDLRLWKSFTTKEEKSQWWAEATASLRNWWEVESSVCRVDDGLSGRLDKDRARRIKALGNSIVPQIAELIGEVILDYEEKRCPL